ncbi:MAG TPA: thymidine phosphorylase [Firmicutes bacterium]|nr:thymidine phosphorylase [Bacillota bacterium]
MEAYELILKKRRGESMTEEEMSFWIQGIVKGTIPDYQVAAWLMAVYFNGMTAAETAFLTKMMVLSGQTLDLSTIPGVVVDKHSTGGVGDKTTLVVAPLVAACGAPVVKLSGRGLGHTGGTLDKLEAIPGMRVDLSQQEILDQARAVGLVIAGQTADLVPADKLLYALRDVTATVDSIPLIAASIMSKKLAAGAAAFVFDVKTGGGAFMKDPADARRLAQLLVDIAAKNGKKAVAVISGMWAPLGRAVGNALEVAEAVAVLRGGGPPDLLELSLVLGSHMLVLAGKAQDAVGARRLLLEALHSGRGIEALKRMVAAQGGEEAVIDHPELLPRAPVRRVVEAAAAGYLHAVDAGEIGLAAVPLGAGRRRKEDRIDPSAGIELLVKPGEEIVPGRPLAVIHAQDTFLAEEAAARVKAAFTIRSEPLPAPEPLIVDIVAD